MIAAWCEHHHMKPLQHSHDILNGGSRWGPGGPCPPPFLNQTEARRAKKNILETAPPGPHQLSKGLDLPLILCFAFQLHVQCLIVLCFCVSVKSFASVFSLTSCCSSRRNDSTQLVTSTYLMISERAWSRAAKKPGSIINAKKTSLFRLCSMILFL